MLRRSGQRFGVLGVIVGELGKVGEIARYEWNRLSSTLKGHDGETPESIAQKEKKREMMREYESLNAKKATSATAGDSQKSKWEALKEALADAKNTMASATSKQAGVVALVQHCAAAHAAEVAIANNIDVKSVTVQMERDAISGEETVVGYIDAPAATEEEVYVYAQKLEQACPAAKLHGAVEWRQKPRS
jgi:hypothetical protein